MNGADLFSELNAISVRDIYPLATAFLFGLLSRLVGLPPLVGFLAAGFLLGGLGYSSSLVLQEIADVGVTLLLFSIGLKLDLRHLLLPAIWATTTIHMALTTLLAGLLLFGLGSTGIAVLSGIDLQTAMLIGFALSFSSTVFAVKILEQQGELETVHGRIAIGVLIMQDLMAVIFIALSAGKVPSVWALALLLLIPARPLLLKLLIRTGHGELLIMFGWLAPLAAASAFEAVGVKADLGALVLGVILAGHPKSVELAKALLSFKDLFLIGFFLTIGLSGALSWSVLGIAAALLLLIPIKGALYFWLMARFRLRARSATLASFNLANFSEFGLIIAALGAGSGWLSEEWLTILAISVSLSFLLASPLNAMGERIYRRLHGRLNRFEGEKRLPNDEFIDPADAQVIIFGMGRVGSGAYEALQDEWGGAVLAIDQSRQTVERQRRLGRNVILGDAADSDFWTRVRRQGRVKLVLLAMDHSSNLQAAKNLQRYLFAVEVMSVARFSSEAEALQREGVAAVFNLYAEAGRGFAAHVLEKSTSRATLGSTSADVER